MSMSLAVVGGNEKIYEMRYKKSGGKKGPSGVMFNMHLQLADELPLNWPRDTIG